MNEIGYFSLATLFLLTQILRNFTVLFLIVLFFSCFLQLRFSLFSLFIPESNLSIFFLPLLSAFVLQIFSVSFLSPDKFVFTLQKKKKKIKVKKTNPPSPLFVKSSPSLDKLLTSLNPHFLVLSFSLSLFLSLSLSLHNKNHSSIFAIKSPLSLPLVNQNTVVGECVVSNPTSHQRWVRLYWLTTKSLARE